MLVMSGGNVPRVFAGARGRDLWPDVRPPTMARGLQAVPYGGVGAAVTPVPRGPREEGGRQEGPGELATRPFLLGGAGRQPGFPGKGPWPRGGGVVPHSRGGGRPGGKGGGPPQRDCRAERRRL